MAGAEHVVAPPVGLRQASACTGPSGAAPTVAATFHTRLEKLAPVRVSGQTG